jgi:hypothetical protein
MYQALFREPNLLKFYHLVVLRVISSSSPMDLSCKELQTILQRSHFLEEIEFDVVINLS